MAAAKKTTKTAAKKSTKKPATKKRPPRSRPRRPAARSNSAAASARASITRGDLRFRDCLAAPLLITTRRPDRFRTFESNRPIAFSGVNFLPDFR